MTDKVQPKNAEQPTRNWHMYVWTKQPFFHAVAQAVSVDEARNLLLEEIGGGDGSCPEREAAARWVREQQPSIYHRSNAEFSLTDSAELREQEAYVETLQKQIAAEDREIERLNRAIADWESREASVVPEESTFEAEIERLRKERDELLPKHICAKCNQPSMRLVDGCPEDFYKCWLCGGTAEKPSIAMWEARCRALSEGLRKRADDFRHPALADHRFSGETVAHELDKLLADPASPAESTETKEKP